MDTTLLLGPRREILIQSHRHVSGFDVAAFVRPWWGDLQAERQFELKVRTDTPVGVWSAEAFSWAWEMRSGSLGRGALADFLSAVVTALGVVRPGRLARGRGHVRFVLRTVREHLCELSEHAIDVCHPQLREIARRFDPSLRFWLYGLLVADVTGRVAQAADVCPGLLIAAHAFLARGDHASTAAILEGLVAGRRLQLVIAEAVDSWMAAHSTADPEQRANQCLLFRRAGTYVEPALLFKPAPTHFLPEDIPRAPLPNVVWFRMVKMFQDLSPKEATGRFVSCHASAIHKWTRRAASTVVMTLMEHLAQDLATPSRRPSRGAGEKAVTEFLEQTWAWCRFCFLIHEPDVHLPSLEGTGPWTNGAVLIIPIDTPMALWKEGQAVGHCAGGSAHEAVLGLEFYFAAMVGQEPLTIMVDKSRRVREVRGRGNRLPTPEEKAALKPWFATHALVQGDKPAPRPMAEGDSDLPRIVVRILEPIEYALALVPDALRDQARTCDGRGYRLDPDNRSILMCVCPPTAQPCGVGDLTIMVSHTPPTHLFTPSVLSLAVRKPEQLFAAAKAAINNIGGRLLVPGLIASYLSDVRTFLAEPGRKTIAEGAGRFRPLMRWAREHQRRWAGDGSALVLIRLGVDGTLREVDYLCSEITRAMTWNANINFAANIDAQMPKGRIEVSVLSAAEDRYRVEQKRRYEWLS